MNQLGFPLLSIVIFLPLAGAMVALLLGRSRTAGQGLGACRDPGRPGAGLRPVGLFRLWHGRDAVRGPVRLDRAAGHQLLCRRGWHQPLAPAADRVSQPGRRAGFLEVPGRPARGRRPRPTSFSCLALETGVLGVFAALDLVLFFIFWEAMLVPAYFLIGRWGGERRIYATLKFFLYTMAGSALMLVAIIALAALNYQATGVLTFDLLALYDLPLGGRPRSGSSWPLSWPLPSRRRSGRCIPGCPMPTSSHPRR